MKLTVVEGGNEERPPVRSRPRERGYCLHRHVELDRTARRVYCSGCTVEIDAFTFLELLARDFERWTITHDQAKAECGRMEARLADLKRQVRNAKAQLRRLT